MDQKNLGTQECVKGGPDACSPHMGHHPSCGHVAANPRVNTKAQQHMRDTFEAAQNGGMMPGMMPGTMQGMGAGGYPGMGAGGYPGGIGMPVQHPAMMGMGGGQQAPQYGPQGQPQHVGVDVMGQWPQQGFGGGNGHANGHGMPQPQHPQLGAGQGQPQAGPSVAIAQFAGGAPTTRTERLERASLAIYVAMVRSGKTSESVTEQEPHTLATVAVRAARALIDEVDAVIQRS